MKKIAGILSISLIIFLLTSCTGVKTTTSGLENECFLIFVGNPRTYSDGVDVIVDDKTSFKAEVIKQTSSRPKGKIYALSTGTHNISVSYNNQEIYKKQIFLAAQETRIIVLP